MTTTSAIRAACSSRTRTNLGPEWSPSRLDRRHQFNGYALFYLPLNFDVSTNFRFLSAVPIDAAFGSDVNASLGGPDRPSSAPGVPFERNAFRNEPFKEVNFKLQWGLPFGNGSRLLLFTDVFNVFNWDNIQLAGAAVTNYCAAPVPADCGFGEPTNPTFLSLTDTSGNLIRTNNPGLPRQIQFGARFQF